MEIRFLRLQWKSHELLRGVRVAVMLGALAALAYGWVDTRNSIQTYEGSMPFLVEIDSTNMTASGTTARH